jgi:exodeoxyribonuclease VII large subunit
MKVYSVSEITRGIKGLLEDHFSDVWIEGEISNFKPASSGHFYFSLKDEQAQIRAVMFRGSNSKLKFHPENGLHVLAYGRLSVYEPRGEYQIILDHLEPKGAGALQLAFEQLKKKLEAEGLFDEARKRPIPFLPSKIGIVTSPTGAVIRDMIHVLTRRFPDIGVLLDPVLVQGAAAAGEIASAVRRLGGRGDLDVLIVARGGGSMEDLWAFNEEVVARAIAECPIPVISAVGHETDFTIADFVADLRAPTPSAAAEVAVPVKEDLLEGLEGKRRRLRQAAVQRIETLRLHLRQWQAFFRDPGRRLAELLLRLDHLRERLTGLAAHRIEVLGERLKGVQKHLDSLNPLAILERGYAVVTPEGVSRPLRRAGEVRDGDRLKIRLYEGDLSAVASRPRGDGKT